MKQPRNDAGTPPSTPHTRALEERGSPAPADETRGEDHGRDSPAPPPRDRKDCAPREGELHIKGTGEDADTAIEEAGAPVPRNREPLGTDLSLEARALLSAAIGPKTAARYAAYVKPFKEWLADKHIDIHKVTDLVVANWLAHEQSVKGLSGGALAQRRAAISEMLTIETGRGLPESALLARLTKGVHKKHPKAPRKTNEVWDFTIVTDHIRKELADNKKLDNNHLLGKVVILLEASGLRVMDCTTISRKHSTFECDEKPRCMNLRILPKETRKMAFVNALVPGVPECCALCPHCAVQEVLARTRALKDADSLLVHPNGGKAGKPFSSDWLRNLARKIMDEAGVPAEIAGTRVGAHSVRTAAASLAAARGVPLQTIQAIFRWSASANTFQAHYRKVTFETSQQVTSCLLGLAGTRPDAD